MWGKERVCVKKGRRESRKGKRRELWIGWMEPMVHACTHAVMFAGYTGGVGLTCNLNASEPGLFIGSGEGKDVIETPGDVVVIAWVEIIKAKSELGLDGSGKFPAFLKFNAVLIAFVKDGVAVNPLGMGDIEQIGDKACRPLPGAEGGVKRTVVGCLNGVPVLGYFSLSSMEPANGILGKGGM